MLAAVAALALAGQDVQGLARATAVMQAYLPGQREIITGLTPYRDTMMQVIYQTDRQPEFPAGGGTVAPGGLIEKALGWVRWSVKDDVLFGKPCRVLRCEGQLKEKLTPTMEVTLHDIRQWWVDADGKILRQFERQARPNVIRTANCTYGKDSIDISVEDEKGRRAMSVYPSMEMHELHDQFKPMMVDGKIVLEEKQFVVFDPFSSRFDRYTARVSGWAGGTYFAMKFEGRAFEVSGPRLKQTVAVSKEGDMIKVELPKERFIVMQQVPQGKERAGG